MEIFERRLHAALDTVLAARDRGWYWMATEVAYRARRYDLVRQYADSLRVASEHRRGGSAGDFGAAMGLATAHAYLGQYEEAWRHMDEALGLVRHALARSQVRRDIAELYVVTGRHDEAVALIGQLLSRPGDAFSVAILERDPIWDPLRQRADFRALFANRL